MNAPRRTRAAKKAGRVEASPLLGMLRDALARAADSGRAPKMQAYMKSEMPYHGVSSVPARKIFKELLGDLEFATLEDWKTAVLDLWNHAEFREERYAAIFLTGTRRSRDFQTLEALPLYETLIVEGAWWDYVDEVAIHRVGPILQAFPDDMKSTMRAWSTDDDFWKRRTSIISQNSFKKDTDLELLYECIEPSLSSREFFLRKAIGWALRQYAWTDPKEVARYVREHEDRLSALSRREALKNISPSRKGE